MNFKRLRKLNQKDLGDGPVLYWMDRERRAHDNWAMICAQLSALKHEQGLIVAYAVPKTFLESAWRQHHFMFEGLKEVQKELEKKGIPFVLLLGDPDKEIEAFVKKQDIGCVVTDFSPLRLPRKWRENLKKKLKVAFFEVDARNIVPVWEASNKQEYAAYTIRPKIHKALDEFLEDFPKLKKHPHKAKGSFPKPNWKKAEQFIDVDHDVKPVDWIKPGEKAAMKMFQKFLDEKLDGYDEKRNDPNEDDLSNLSPYLHYGMISAQRIAFETDKLRRAPEDRKSFLEELIVRRELSDNYCTYCQDYDNFKGFADWARKTLDEHRDDEREYLYTKKQFEKADTHDPLWNACQIEMVLTGKMHGYMRMYWAKKILEWTKSPEDAQKIAIYLNDKYELDGRDSNGYVGVAWAIGGVHDRAWTERDVFGKIRYMNDNGCKRKFKVQEYIDKYLGTDTPKLFA